MSELERERLGDAALATRLEWLATNGVGGFASGTVSGALSRRYHGLLVAALEPPLGRTLLLAKLAERIQLDDVWVDLDTNRWASGALDPQGHVHLESFRLEATIPTWVWAIGDTRLEKRVWMEHGENTTWVEYRLAAGHAPLTLELRALVNHREVDRLTASGVWQARVETAASGLRIEAFEGATPLWLTAPGAEIRPAHDWYRGYAYPLEAELGRDALEDHLMAGEFAIRLEPGESATLVASTRREAGLGGVGGMALAAARLRHAAHERTLMDAWQRSHRAVARSAPVWIRRLVLAADAFVIERGALRDFRGRAVVAAYPSPVAGGRGPLAALSGLALATGRPEIARDVLGAMARQQDRGMLPARVSAAGGPEYDSVDAALWFFQAVRAYHVATRDDAFLAELYPVLEDIGAWCERGTRFGIGVDPRDGLLKVNGNGVSLTWMDARLDDRPVTPRTGKPVDVNALWYNALTTMAAFARHLRRPTEVYEEAARRVATNFSRYWNDDLGGLYDVIDGPRGPDPAIRPNQLLAVSLPDSPLPFARRRAVLDICGRLLLTSYGLRSLVPADARYCGRWEGDAAARAAACHQGTAWVWLLPHYALAHFRVHRDRAAALALLEPLGDLMMTMGIGFLPEATDGDPPHAPRGVLAHAWSVGEALRAFHTLAGTKRTRKPPRSRTASRAAVVSV